MPLHSSTDPTSSDFARNAEAMRALVAELREKLDSVAGGGGEASRARHTSRGKMLARQRVDLLIDPGTAFLELSPLAANGMYDNAVHGAGVITGIGRIEGRECVIVANDATIKGGSYFPMTVKKHLRAQEIARENRLPCVYLVDSGGANLPTQTEVFPDREHFGRIFYNQATLSSLRIPQIAVVMGSCTAGGAYVPAMSDESIIVKNQGTIFLGGPPLVKMAIDEDADEEELGGAEMHARTSGLADYLGLDEPDTLRIGRDIVAHLNWHKLGPGPRTGDPDPPAHDPDELLGIASADVRVPFEVREVIARLVDGSRFEEFKPLYGTTLVTGWAHLDGMPIGILANNGILFSEEAEKGAQFIQLCERHDVPILFVQNITGFMVGTRYEQGGIIKDGAKLINAVSNSTVPHLTLMVGASYGAGNYGMSGRAYDPRFVFTWPNHRIAVMGPKQLGGVLSIVARQRTEAAGATFDEAAFAPMREAFESQVEAQSTALYSTGRLWDDGIIDPRDTRTVLCLALSAAHSAPVQGTSSYGVFRM